MCNKKKLAKNDEKKRRINNKIEKMELINKIRNKINNKIK